MSSDLSWMASSSRFEDVERPYRLIEFEQGSEAWKEWRLKGLGSTSAAIILGDNPYKSSYQLWRELVTGEESFKGNAHTRAGTEAEPEIRRIYAEHVGLSYVPECAEHISIPHFRSSMDGINHKTRSIIEIKSHDVKAMTKLRVNGVHKMYLAQMQWHLMVTGYDECTYVAAPRGWGGNPSVLYTQRVEKDLEWQRQLIDKADLFWEHVTNRVPPDTAEEELDDLQLENKIIDRQVLLAKKKVLDKEIEEITADIKSYVKSDKAVCGKFKLQFVTSKGRVNYDEIPELSGVDLDKYRGAESISFKIGLKREDL